jgi:hypothetical protein
MFRSLNCTPETNAKLADFVLNHLVRMGGQESISCLLSNARYAGWRGFPHLHAFEVWLKDNGFTVTYVYNKGNGYSKPGTSVVKTVISL